MGDRADFSRDSRSAEAAASAARRVRGGVYAWLWASAAALVMGLLAWGCGAEGSGGGGSAKGEAAGAGERGEAARLVVLSPGLASVVRELGREEALVGRHRSDAWSDRGIPAVGDNLRVEVEALLAVRPSVVVTEAAKTAPAAGLERALELSGAEWVRVPVLELDDLPGAVRVLDRLTRGLGVGEVEGERVGEGDEDGAGEGAGEGDGEGGVSAEAAGLLDRLEAAFAADAEVAARLGRTVVIASTEPMGVTGPGSFHHDLVERLGGEALPGEGGPWQTLWAEDVASLAPETVVLLVSEAVGEGRVDAAARLPALAMVLPGLFEAGRVVVIADEEALLPGPGLIRVAEKLRAAAMELEPVVGAGVEGRVGAGGD